MIFHFFFITFISFTSVYADVKVELSKIITEAHHPLNYEQANFFLFTKIDNHNGIVCSVYSPSECINTDVVPSPKIMNIEHTWPQSNGANGPAKSDLHHLFPTSSATNSIRSSLPFCNVVTVKWEADQSRRGLNSFGEHCFEPPAAHKGKVARALFYFSLRYQMPIDDHQESFLRIWHKEYPVTEEERERNKAISLYQNNSNPFIDQDRKSVV